MDQEYFSQKKVLINRLANSGINISPKSIEIILKMDNPLIKTDLIIEEMNINPTFNGHLTLDVIQRISNEEIQRVLKRENIKIKCNEKTEYKENNLKIDKVNIPASIKKEVKNSLNTQNSISIPQRKKPMTIDPLPAKRQHSKIKQFESTKSSLSFKPIAKDYEFEYKILKDPNGKLFTNGNFDDFYEMTVDKYNSLRELMRKRTEVLSATNIEKINRLSNNAEVSTMGLIKSIRLTKNQNYLLILEDLTGEVNVLIKKNNEDLDELKKTERIVNDQMIYVEGVYNPSNSKGKGIIFANNFTKIDIPTNFQTNKAKEPLAVALISDTHIGSKEFEETLFNKFIQFLNGKVGDNKVRKLAGKIKYLVINGDLIDGIGVYPNQNEDLLISDIYKQYDKATEFIKEVPEYIKIFYVSGNHEPVRNAIARPAVPKKYCKGLADLGVKFLGNPSLISTHGVNTLIFHGESMHDLNMSVPDLDIKKPTETMKELLICRHLAPVYGGKTQIAPTSKDWLVIDTIPDIFHTGHLHINGFSRYRNVNLINSGCFQGQTDFMRSFGIDPTIGIVPVIELDSLKSSSLDFKKQL
ncbi:MAG: metallophosphoesterase [Candidatus Lokiarchaeota archaeon]|nr:metallophosphoesterase [Candidatus Lokiarchaeota archaeon]